MSSPAAYLRKKIALNREWYSLRSILGYWYMIFFFLLGGREAGKSYAVTKEFVRQFVLYGRIFYWIRLSETSAQKLLVNNAEKLIDPDIRREFGLDLATRGDAVYCVLKRDDKGKIKEKKLMCRVICLATFYNDKGSGFFDKDFLDDPNMYYNICLDEMNREKNEKKSFDIVYSFTNQLENLIRSTKRRIRVICIGNTLEEASDILCAFNFLPETFGRFKLVRNKKKLIEYLTRYDAAKTPEERAALDEEYRYIDFGKRAIIEYIEPSDKYKTRRKGTIADILMPTASTFTNEIKVDDSLVTKQRLIKPSMVIKFSKEMSFTVWDGNVIAEYNNEKAPVVAMRPYIDSLFNAQMRDSVITMFDTRCYKYRNLITFKRFQKELELLKPRK